MTDQLRVILEIGKKRRVVAGAMDWPGLDRWGTSEEDALAKLESYLPRYAGVAERAGLSSAFKRHGPMTVVERVPGSSSTDFWGIAHVPSEIEREVLSSKDLERRLAVLQATLGRLPRHVHACLRRASTGPARRRPNPRRDHPPLYASERHNFWRKVGIRPRGRRCLTPDELAAHREEYVDAIRAYNAESKPARSWPIQFLIRRTAQHAMDHAWEMEDRDLCR